MHIKNIQQSVMATIIWFLCLALIACSATKEQKPSQEELTKDLFHSIMDQDFISTKELIDGGANLNVHDFEGYTPLLRTLKFNNSNLVGLLIKGGAKLYFPHGKNKKISPFSLLDPSNKEMARVIDSEVKRYGAKIESLIKNSEYRKALYLSVDDYLPFDLEMPKSEKKALTLIIHLHRSESYRDKRVNLSPTLLEYVSYLLKKIPNSPDDNSYSYLVAHEDSVRQLFELTIGTPARAVIYDIYNQYAQSLKAKSSLRVLTISTHDLSNLHWVNLKLKFLNDSESPLPLSSAQRQIYMESIISELTPTSFSWRKLTNHILQSSNNYSLKKYLC